MSRVIVASANPVKMEAVRQGFALMFPDMHITLEGHGAPSGVSDQPLGDNETRRGATNRAKHIRQQYPDADYWVGIEGGCTLHDDDNSASVYAWVVVLGKGEQVGHSKTGVFFLPDEVTRFIRQGMELGHADDEVFGRTNSKQDTGSVGILTGDVITRTSYYVHAVALALIPFHTPTLTFPRF